MPSRTVLLVDGDLDSLVIYSTLLEHHGFSVLLASTDEEGARLAGERHPDLVIVEPCTPSLHGKGILPLLRDNSRTADIPRLILSSIPAHVRAGRGLAAEDGGGERSFTKPLHPRRLLSAVEEMLETVQAVAH